MKKITIAYETWTPEDIENGDTDDKGWIDEEGIDMTPDEYDTEDEVTAIDNAVKFLKNQGAYEPSSSHWDSRVWYTNPKYDEDYSTGAIESRSYFLEGFTDEESQEIFNRITKKTMGESVKYMKKITLVEAANRFFDNDEEVVNESETYTNELLESADNVGMLLEYFSDENPDRHFLVYYKGYFKTPFVKEYEEVYLAKQDMKKFTGASKVKFIDAKNPQEALNKYMEELKEPVQENEYEDVMEDDQDNSIDEFTKAYIEAALWTSTDDNADPLDDKYGLEDIAEESLQKIKSDCKKFQDDNRDLYTEGGWSDSQAGHDFWLTRDHQGAGFWDRSHSEGYDEETGKKLTEITRSFADMDLYVGDDGRLHV